MRRAQTAVEFLTTYGWVLVGLLILLAVLLYYGAFDPLRFVPRQCTFEPGLPCTSHKLEVNQTTGTVRVITQLSNDLGYDISLPDNAMLIQVENIGKAGKNTYVGNCSPKAPYIIKKGGSFTCIVEIPDKEVIPQMGKNVRLQAGLVYRNCLTDPNYLVTGNCSSAANYTSEGTAVTPVEGFSPTMYCGDGICSSSIGENPTTCPVDCPSPVALLLTASPAIVLPDGISKSTITAKVLGVSGPLNKVEVVFMSTPIGKLSSISAVTNVAGIATVQLSSNTAGKAAVTAIAYIANTTNVTFSSLPTSIKLTASDYYPPICGFDSIITATVKDVGNNPVGDMNVNFYHTSGNPSTKLEPGYGITDGGGQVTSRFYNDGMLETLQVTGTLTVPELDYTLSDTITLSTSNCSCEAPPSGIWMVNRRVICSNQTIVLNGDLTILNKGDLIFLGNVTLNMNGYNIRVNCGGTFRIYDTDHNPATTADRSVISGSLNQGQYFIVDPCGMLDMENSELRGIYYNVGGGMDTSECSQTSFGAVIYGNSTKIINNTILDEWQGITFINSFNNTISGNVINYTALGGVTLINTTDTIVSNNTFPKTGVGVCLSNSHRNKIDRNNIALFAGQFRYTGLSPGSGGGLRVKDGSSYNNITNNVVPYARSCVYTFQITNSHYNRIENNWLAYCSLDYGGTGIVMSGSDNNIINNNSFNNVGYKGTMGMSITSSSSNLISNNLINTTYFNSISLIGGSGNRLENNSVGLTGYRAAIAVDSSPSTVIYNNKVWNNTAGGIKLTSSPNSVIYRNNASDSTYYYDGTYTTYPGIGIWVSNSSNANISENYAANNGGDMPSVGQIGGGIAIFSSPGSKIINNTAVNNFRRGIYSESSANVLIERNNASNNNKAHVVHCTSYCDSAGIWFVSTDNTARAVNNTVIGNDYGFYCGTSTPTLQDNNATSNGDDWDSCPQQVSGLVYSCGTITTNSTLMTDRTAGK